MGGEEEVNFEGVSVSKGENKGLYTMRMISAIETIVPYVRRSIQNGDKLLIVTHLVHDSRQIA